MMHVKLQVTEEMRVLQRNIDSAVTGAYLWLFVHGGLSRLLDNIRKMCTSRPRTVSSSSKPSSPPSLTACTADSARISLYQRWFYLASFPHNPLLRPDPRAPFSLYRLSSRLDNSTQPVVVAVECEYNIRVVILRPLSYFHYDFSQYFVSCLLSASLFIIFFCFYL